MSAGEVDGKIDLKGDEDVEFPVTKIHSLNRYIVGDLAEQGEWIVANVTTRRHWPINTQRCRFQGESVWVLPVTVDYYPALAVLRRPGMTVENAQKLLMQFLSVLSWVTGYGFMVEGFSGGDLPRPMGLSGQISSGIMESFDLSYLPEPTSQRARLALALMREGRGLNHSAYAFLSYFRVLESALADGKQRGEWISTAIDELEDDRARRAVARLRESGVENVSSYLREAGRLAIAHAKQDPIVDPDDPLEMRRLSGELPIMEALAERAIEVILGVETSSTVFRKHLYELEGFRRIFGSEFIDIVNSGGDLPELDFDIFPAISLGIEGRSKFFALQNLCVYSMQLINGNLYLYFLPDRKNFRIKIGFDFVCERLLFDMFDDIVISDNGSAQCAFDIVDIYEFMKFLFLNGKIQIHNMDTEELLSRKDAYLPHNMTIDLDKFNEKIAAWRRVAEEREKSLG